MKPLYVLRAALTTFHVWTHLAHIDLGGRCYDSTFFNSTVSWSTTKIWERKLSCLKSCN
jgi:hypothetical protein